MICNRKGSPHSSHGTRHSFLRRMCGELFLRLRLATNSATAPPLLLLCGTLPSPLVPSPQARPRRPPAARGPAHHGTAPSYAMLGVEDDCGARLPAWSWRARCSSVSLWTRALAPPRYRAQPRSAELKTTGLVVAEHGADERGGRRRRSDS